MSIMITRVPRIDWDKGFNRHWNDDNPAATHAFNALSFLFPQAERYFIESARDVFNGLDEEIRSKVETEVKGFIAQESIHSKQHSTYNGILEEQGYSNVVYDSIERLQQRLRRYFSPLTNLAMVAGYEHFTAILGNFILKNPQVLKQANPDMALIWGWHSAEETEHKAVCFDLYKTAGGGWLRRVLAYSLVSANFYYLFSRVYLHMLYRDGCLKPKNIFRTSKQYIKFFFGRTGIAWHILWYGLKYLNPIFHPWQQNNRSSLDTWLENNQSRLRVIGE